LTGKGRVVRVERVVRSNGEVVWRVRWREGQRNRSKVLGRKRDAEAFDAEVRHRRRTGELRFLDAGSETLVEYVRGHGRRRMPAHLAPKTRHSYVWVYEGRSVIYVGHGANLTMSTYGHVIEELEDQPQLSAEDAIRQARTRLVPLASGQ
jgi:hypothetical protein